MIIHNCLPSFSTKRNYLKMKAAIPQDQRADNWLKHFAIVVRKGVQHP